MCLCRVLCAVEETFQTLQEIFGDESLSRSQCREWYKRFKEGWTSSEDKSCLGCQSNSIEDDHVARMNVQIVE